MDVDYDDDDDDGEGEGNGGKYDGEIWKTADRV